LSLDWDRLASAYPRQVPWERVALAAAVDLAGLAPEETLVDLGTGTGELLAEVARRQRRPRIAIGVDTSPAMLRHVPSLPSGWRVMRASVEALPLGAGSADVVTAAYLLHVLADDARANALAEARRVLRPGGRFVCVTPFAPRRGAARAGAAALDLAAAVAPGRLGGLRTLDPRPELAASGFTVLRARTLRRGYPSLCVLARL